jgi:hypothetical protein
MDDGSLHHDGRDDVGLGAADHVSQHPQVGQVFLATPDLDLDPVRFTFPVVQLRTMLEHGYNPGPGILVPHESGDVVVEVFRASTDEATGGPVLAYPPTPEELS